MLRTQPSLSVTAETPVAPRAFAKRQHCRTYAMRDVVAPLVPTARAAPRRSMRRLGLVTLLRVGMPRERVGIEPAGDTAAVMETAAQQPDAGGPF